MIIPALKEDNVKVDSWSSPSARSTPKVKGSFAASWTKAFSHLQDLTPREIKLVLSGASNPVSLTPAPDTGLV